MKNIMRTLEQVIAEARALSGGAPENDPVALARQRHVCRIADTLSKIGFPENASDKAKLSIVPLIFQEANYDDIAWMRQEEDLRQLRGYFELDYLVQNGGQERAEACAAELAAHVEEAHGAIRYWRNAADRRKEMRGGA
jgi:hypothetical protein